jgi:hypothetical protein
MKRKTLGRILGLGVKAAVAVFCPPLGVFLALQELPNLAAYVKHARGNWEKGDEDKVDALKMLAGSPSAAVKLLGKIAFKGNPPKVYNVFSQTIANTFTLASDVHNVCDAIDKIGVNVPPPKKS